MVKGEGSTEAPVRVPRSMTFDAVPAPSRAAEVVPPRRTRRDELARLIKQYVTHEDRAPDEEAAFVAWTREHALGTVRVLGTVCVALIVLTWPGDLRFRGEHDRIFDAFVIWRSAAIGLLAPFIIAHRIPLFRRHPLRAALTAYVGFVAVLGYSLGRIDGLDSPWFYALYGSAWMTVIFPVRPLERVAWSLMISFVGTLAYFVPHPQHFAHTYVDVPLINLASFTAVAILVGHIVRHLARDSYFARREVEAERARTEQVLRNILPDSVAARLKRDRAPIGHRYDAVTVMFTDIVGFTRLAGKIEPEALLRFLNDLFTRFDLIAERHGLEKIKTIGDGYVVAGGVPDPRDDHAVAIADMALELIAVAATMRDPDGGPVELRIGIQTGPVVAGVIGVKKLTYDLWGDTVNTASRLESHGIPGKIHIGDECSRLLGADFEIEARGTIELKGKGQVPTFFLLGRRH